MLAFGTDAGTLGARQELYLNLYSSQSAVSIRFQHIILFLSMETVQQLLSVTNLLLLFRIKSPIRLFFILNYWTASISHKSRSDSYNSFISEFNSHTLTFACMQRFTLSIFHLVRQSTFQQFSNHTNNLRNLYIFFYQLCLTSVYSNSALTHANILLHRHILLLLQFT